MTHAEFTRAAAHLAQTTPATLRACRLVLVEGIKPIEAARRMKLTRGAVSKALAKIPREFCPCCEQAIQRAP